MVSRLLSSPVMVSRRLDNELGRRMAAARIAAGFSRDELAEILAVSSKTVMRAESQGFARRVLIWAWASACSADREWLETGAGLLGSSHDSQAA